MKAIILGNGKRPQKRTIQYLKRQGYERFICADGGANSAYKMRLQPDYIIGDMDSVEPEIIEYFEGASVIMKYDRQDDTDIEKCLKFAIDMGWTEAVLLGATGDRLDHSFCNMGIAIKYFDDIRIRLIAEKSILTVHTGLLELRSLPGEIISIYGIDDDTIFTSWGLKYPLTGFSLPFGKRESTSNVSTQNTVKISIENGKGLIIRDFSFVRKHGLF